MAAKHAKQQSNQSVMLFVLVIGIIVLFFWIYKCNSSKHTPPVPPSPERIDALEIPQATKGNEEVHHKAYTLSFNPQFKEASWVAYLLTGYHMFNANEARTNTFTQDPLLHSDEANNDDYNRSGYDRGHLAPAEDMAWSKETMQECFYYSNMSPQKPEFNRGVWKRLEELVRYWSQAYDSIYVVTGPVFTPHMQTLGPDKIAIPEVFYKVILEYNKKEVKGIGFVLRNEASTATLKDFAVSIDSVEHLTGINFFPKLDDNIEEKIESNPQADSWPWQRKRIASQK